MSYGERSCTVRSTPQPHVYDHYKRKREVVGLVFSCFGLVFFPQHVFLLANFNPTFISFHFCFILSLLSLSLSPFSLSLSLSLSLSHSLSFPLIPPPGPPHLFILIYSEPRQYIPSTFSLFPFSCFILFLWCGEDR